MLYNSLQLRSTDNIDKQRRGGCQLVTYILVTTYRVCSKYLQPFVCEVPTDTHTHWPTDGTETYTLWSTTVGCRRE